MPYQAQLVYKSRGGRLAQVLKLWRQNAPADRSYQPDQLKLLAELAPTRSGNIKEDETLDLEVRGLADLTALRAAIKRDRAQEQFKHLVWTNDLGHVEGV